MVNEMALHVAYEDGLYHELGSPAELAGTALGKLYESGYSPTDCKLVAGHGPWKVALHFSHGELPEQVYLFESNPAKAIRLMLAN